MSHRPTLVPIHSQWLRMNSLTRTLHGAWAVAGIGHILEISSKLGILI